MDLQVIITHTKLYMCHLWQGEISILNGWLHWDDICHRAQTKCRAIVAKFFLVRLQSRDIPAAVSPLTILIRSVMITTRKKASYKTLLITHYIIARKQNMNMCAYVMRYAINFKISLIGYFHLIYEMPLNWLALLWTHDEGTSVIATLQTIGWLGIIFQKITVIYLETSQSCSTYSVWYPLHTLPLRTIYTD